MTNTLTQREPWCLIGRGFAGWHALANDEYHTRSSGGDLLPYTYWTGEKCPGYAAEALEGCPVYDASGCEENQASREAFCKLIISGPIVNAATPDGPAGTFDQARALDYISTAEFMRRVSAIPGVKVGRVVNGQPVWEEGRA